MVKEGIILTDALNSNVTTLVKDKVVVAVVEEIVADKDEVVGVEEGQENLWQLGLMNVTKTHNFALQAKMIPESER